MSATVTVTRNFGPLTDLQFTDTEIMREIGLLERERIVRRTQSGRAVDGSPFTPLSPEYAKQKRAALGTARADLTVSGNMLNDIAITNVEEDSVTLGWTK